MMAFLTQGDAAAHAAACSRFAELSSALRGLFVESSLRANHMMLERQHALRAPPRMSSPGAQLSEVKALCREKCGEDVDEENLCVEDGMLWVKTVGTGVTKFCPSQAAETKPAPAGGKFRTLIVALTT